jgi:HEAT repeat protein
VGRLAFLAGVLLGSALLLPGCGGSEPRFEGRTVAGWQDVLVDGAQPVERRRQAAQNLGSIASNELRSHRGTQTARDALARAVRALAAARASDTDEEVRRVSVVALGTPGLEAVRELVAALDDASPRVVEAALVALGNQGPGAVAAAGPMAARLSSRIPTVATQAALNLGRLGPEVVPALEPYLTHEVAWVRERAVEVLLAADPTSPRTGERLARAAKDREWTVRRRALAGLGPHAARDVAHLDLLERAFADENPFVVVAAANGAARAGPQAVRLVRPLAALLTSEHGPVRAAAAEALGLSVGAGLQVLPQVEAALAKETGIAKVPLLVARWRITGETGPLVAGLRPLLLADGPSRVPAVEALAQVGPAAASAVADLIPLINDRNARMAAVETLLAIGPAAAAALPALEAALHDPNEVFRAKATAALKAIRSPEAR